MNCWSVWERENLAGGSAVASDLTAIPENFPDAPRPSRSSDGSLLEGYPTPASPISALRLFRLRPSNRCIPLGPFRRKAGISMRVKSPMHAATWDESYDSRYGKRCDQDASTSWRSLY